MCAPLQTESSVNSFKLKLSSSSSGIIISYQNTKYNAIELVWDEQKIWPTHFYKCQLQPMTNGSVGQSKECTTRIDIYCSAILLHQNRYILHQHQYVRTLPIFSMPNLVFVIVHPACIFVYFVNAINMFNPTANLHIFIFIHCVLFQKLFLQPTGRIFSVVLKYFLTLGYFRRRNILHAPILKQAFGR